MNHSNVLRRRAVIVGLVVVLTASITGCDGVAGTTAATVNGKQISTEQVLSLLKDRKVAADRQAQGAAADLAGPGKDTYKKRAFTDTLNQLVVADLINRELERRNLTVKAADRTTARASLEKSAGAGTLAKLPKGMRDFVVELSAAQSVLQKKVGTKAQSKEAQARAQYDQIKSATPEQLQQICITGATFTSQADATTARARLAKGGSIAAATKGLAVQQVADKEQCAAASQYPAAVQSLKVGGVSAPIANQGIYVVVRLQRRKTLSFAEVQSQLEQNLPEPGAAELQAEVGRLAAKAKVSVDPRYGSWNRQAGRVDPPAGTPTTTAPPTTAPAAGGAAGSGTPDGSNTPSAPAPEAPSGG